MSAQPSRHFTKESTKFLIVTLEHKENNPAKIITLWACKKSMP
jgi:hypothetical protein